VFVPRTSSTPVATWFWQTEGRSAERVILGVRPTEFILSEFHLVEGIESVEQCAMQGFNLVKQGKLSYEDKLHLIY
jgi:hypothetical protein